MAAKIFILAFAAVFWQAQSQFYDGSTPQNPCAASSSLIQSAGNNCVAPNLATLRIKGNVIPTPPVVSARPLNLCLEDESQDLIFGTSRCGPVPNIPRPCRPDIPQICPIAEEICRPNICANECFNVPKPTLFLRSNSPNLRPICALEGSLDNIPCPADIFAFTESNSEANSCLGPTYQSTPKLPNLIFENNRATPNLCSQNNVLLCESSSNIGPCRPVPNIGRINVPSNVQTTTTTETTTTINNAGSPFGAVNNQGTITSTSNAEATTSVNVRPENFIPNIFRGFNKQQGSVSSVATSDATVSVSTPVTYSSNIFGTNITPAQTSVATAESTAVTTSNVGPVRVFLPTSGIGFTNLVRPASVSAAANSEASSATTLNVVGSNVNAESFSFANVRPPGILTSNYCGGVNKVGPTGFSSSCSDASTFTNTGSSNIFTSKFPGPLLPVIQTSSTAEAGSSVSIGMPNACLSNTIPYSTSTCSESASSANISPSRVYFPNYLAGYSNIVQPTVSTVVSSEASSSTNVGPLYRGPTTTSYTSSEAASSIRPANPYLSYSPSVYSGSETLSADMVPVVSVTPYFYGGIPQTVCLSEPTVGPAYIEPPLFYPSSCRQTGVINNIVPQRCASETFLPSVNVFEFSQPSSVGSLNPLAASLNELSEFISSIVPIIENVATCSNPCSYPPAPLPVFGGLGPVYPLGGRLNLAGSCAEASNLVEPQSVTATSTTASSSSTSTVTDINNPLTPCDDEVISSSTASSSSTVVVEEIVPITECFEVIEPVVSSVTATSAFCDSPPSILCQNPCNIGLSPVTMEIEIPSSFPSYLSSDLGVCSSPPALSSYLPISMSPVVYELQIPSSIPALLSCSLESVPSSAPVLSMNVEPIGVCNRSC